MKTTLTPPVFPRLITADGAEAVLPPDVRERIERALSLIHI